MALPGRRLEKEIVAMSGESDLHHIVVVGGGAGGLELVTRLGDRLAAKGKARVTLVERSRTHLWKPLLHEIAAGSMDAAQHEVNYLAHAHWHNFRFRFGEMIGLDRKTVERMLHDLNAVKDNLRTAINRIPGPAQAANG